MNEPMYYNGRAYRSEALTELLRDFGMGLVRQACDELGVEPEDTGVIRAYLNKWEGALV